MDPGELTTVSCHPFRCRQLTRRSGCPLRDL